MEKKTGLLATVKAKPGKEREVEDFLISALPLARQEEKTITWYAFKIDDSTFGIFDTFADEDGRNAHLNGQIAAALMGKADELLADSPNIKKIAILAAK
jgi:quinol monooxygenase YgiN